MTITKTHLKNLIGTRLGLPKEQATQTVEVFLEKMKDTLASEEDITISGFGKFCVKEKKSRKGRNPSTGEDFILDGRRVVTFRCSPILREKMNSDGKE